jgi:uncharacterized protein DUF2568
MTSTLKTLNLGLAFILELAMLAAFVYWGFHTGSTTIVKILLGIGAPVLVATFWGAFMAPNARRHLEGGAYLVVKVLLFGLAVAALSLAGQVIGAIVLAVVFVINTVLLELWK